MKTTKAEQVFREYQDRFPGAWLNPPLCYGHITIPERELVALARAALKSGKPIPWDEMLAELPDGADS